MQIKHDKNDNFQIYFLQHVSYPALTSSVGQVCNQLIQCAINLTFPICNADSLLLSLVTINSHTGLEEIILLPSLIAKHHPSCYLDLQYLHYASFACCFCGTRLIIIILRDKEHFDPYFQCQTDLFMTPLG